MHIVSQDQTDRFVHEDQDAYAILTATVVLSNMWIMERVLRPALKAREDKRPPSSPVPSTRAFLSQMWIMVATGEILAALPAKCRAQILTPTS